MISIIVVLLNKLIKALGFIADHAVKLLPPSPFLAFSNIQIPQLSALNWLIPIDFMVTVTSYWLSAILVYYVVQTILRWAKVIE